MHNIWSSAQQEARIQHLGRSEDSWGEDGVTEQLHDFEQRVH